MIVSVCARVEKRRSLFSLAEDVDAPRRIIMMTWKNRSADLERLSDHVAPLVHRLGLGEPEVYPHLRDGELIFRPPGAEGRSGERRVSKVGSRVRAASR